MAFIPDIDATTPATGDNVSDGDDEIRQLKTDVLGTFSGIGSGAVTATYTQINELADKLNNFVESFEGRQGAVVATAGDYDLDDLGDATITTPATGEVLEYNGSAWVNVAAKLSGMAVYSTDYNAACSTNANFAHLTSADSNTIPAGLGTMSSTTADGTQFTAVAACLVTFNYSCYTPASVSNEFAIVLNGAGSTLPFSQANAAIVTRKNMGNQTRKDITGTVLCAASDVVSLCHRVVTRTTPAEGILRITAVEV